jgi:ABC-type branched-subunit amino acid transport system substrate-binding protein
MSKKFHRRALSFSLFGILALALQGATIPAYAYDINVILPLTGGASFLGKAEQTALQLAEPLINKAGGVQGQPVHFVFYDDGSNPQTGVQLTNRAIAAKPAVLLGSSLVSVCNAMAPLMQDGPAMYCFSPGINEGVFTLDAAVEAAQRRFFDTFKAANEKPDLAATLAWDPTMIVIDALQHLGPNATAQQVRDYIGALKGFAGINGVHDFPKIPQRGLDVQASIVTLWSPTHQTWQLVSKPTGIPLDR